MNFKVGDYVRLTESIESRGITLLKGIPLEVVRTFPNAVHVKAPSGKVYNIAGPGPFYLEGMSPLEVIAYEAE